VPPLGAGFSLTPKMTAQRTGQFATVAGLRTERSTYQLSIDLPIPTNLPLPPDFPRTLTMDGEMWISDQYKEYGALIAAAGNAAVSGLGLGVLPEDGFVVRQITRNPLLGYEVELTVSDIQDVPDDPAAFTIPSDFREVAPPRLGAPAP
jgi:hypothetical protein